MRWQRRTKKQRRCAVHMPRSRVVHSVLARRLSCGAERRGISLLRLFMPRRMRLRAARDDGRRGGRRMLKQAGATASEGR